MSRDYLEDKVDSGVPWLGQVPKHWELKKVKRLFKIQKRIIGEEGPDVLSITQSGIRKKDTKSGDGQLAQNYSKYQIVEVGDFAMNHMDLLTGYVDISPFYGVTSPDYRVFTMTDKQQLAKYYLYIFQQCYKEKIFFPLGHGSSQLGRWRLPADVFNNFMLPVPPPQIQTDIVAFVEGKTARIDTLISKQQRLLELLEEKRRATITSAVTNDSWPREKIKYAATKRDQKVEAVKFLSYIGLEHVESFSGKQIKAEAQSEPEGLILGYAAHDVLFGKLRPYLAKVLLTKDSGVCSSEFIVLKANDKLLPKFLKYSLLNEQFIELINSSTYGAKMPRANWDFIGNATLTLPSLNKQKQIVDHLERQEKLTDQLKRHILKQIELLKERRTSLISHAVTGKVKV